MSKEPLTDAEGEVRELDEEDFAKMRPAREVLPPELVALLPNLENPGRGSGDAATELVTLRLDRDILDRFRAAGPGWKTRINTALRKLAQG